MQTQQLLAKLSKSANSLWSLLVGPNRAPPLVARALAKTSLSPCLSYGLPLWLPTGSTLTKFDATLARPGRVGLGLPRCANTLGVLCELGQLDASSLLSQSTQRWHARMAALDASDPRSAAWRFMTQRRVKRPAWAKPTANPAPPASRKTVLLAQHQRWRRTGKCPALQAVSADPGPRHFLSAEPPRLARLRARLRFGLALSKPEAEGPCASTTNEVALC